VICLTVSHLNVCLAFFVTWLSASNCLPLDVYLKLSATWLSVQNSPSHDCLPRILHHVTVCLKLSATWLSASYDHMTFCCVAVCLKVFTAWLSVLLTPPAYCLPNSFCHLAVFPHTLHGPICLTISTLLSPKILRPMTVSLTVSTTFLSALHSPPPDCLPQISPRDCLPQALHHVSACHKLSTTVLSGLHFRKEMVSLNFSITWLSASLSLARVCLKFSTMWLSG
jgi:hypothetical protein